MNDPANYQKASNAIGGQLLTAQLNFKLSDREMIRILTEQLQDWVNLSVDEPGIDTELVKDYLRENGLQAVPNENVDDYIGR